MNDLMSCVYVKREYREKKGMKIFIYVTCQDIVDPNQGVEKNMKAKQVSCT